MVLVSTGRCRGYDAQEMKSIITEQLRDFGLGKSKTPKTPKA